MCSLQVAASLSEALAAIRSHTFDVVLSDLNINAEWDGFTVIYTAHEANPGCVTILLTGYPAFETALQAIHTEIDNYGPRILRHSSAPSNGGCSLVRRWSRFGNLTSSELYLHA
jgi:ActR/RegA family two-component response regulator